MIQIIFTTPILNEFLDKHMLSANPTFSLVYLFGYRQYAKGATYIDIEQMASAMNVLATDILKGWQYWQTCGLVRINSIDKGRIELSFHSSIESETKKAEDEPKQETQQMDIVEVTEKEEPKRPTVRELPNYSVDDIEKRLADKEIERLFFIAESMNGKLLTDIERKMYLGFHDDLGLSVDVIGVLLDYCISSGKKNHSYLKTVAFDWADRGISNVEEAEDYIARFSNKYKEILGYFGMIGREPIDREKRYFEEWVENWDMEIIQIACEKTIMQKGKISLSYTHGIFKNWKADDIKTIEDIQNLDDKYYEKIKEVREKKSKSSTKSSTKTSKTTQNFEGREWDFDKLEQMEWENLNSEE